MCIIIVLYVYNYHNYKHKMMCIMSYLCTFKIYLNNDNTQVRKFQDTSKKKEKRKKIENRKRKKEHTTKNK